jgi:rod shape-determining protein MreD
MPDLLAVLLVFWSVHQPLAHRHRHRLRVRPGMDVHQSSLLGQHALAYTTLSYFAITMHRRLLWFSGAVAGGAGAAAVRGRALHRARAIRMIGGGAFPGWTLLAPVIEAALWPVVSVLLLAPQRRAPDPDAQVFAHCVSLANPPLRQAQDRLAGGALRSG